MLAIGCDRRVPAAAGSIRADALTAGLPKHAWQRLSAGPGAKGQRFYELGTAHPHPARRRRLSALPASRELAHTADQAPVQAAPGLAVVGIDTHRDVHVAELAGPTGAPLATVQIQNTSAGYAAVLGWIAEHSPGPESRLRSRARALTALRLDADRLPTPRADGTREALRILLSARRELMRSCARTRSYVARRTAEGKAPREIRRALKPYITRQLHRALAATMTS